jgi:hypothetical protein
LPRICVTLFLLPFLFIFFSIYNIFLSIFEMRLAWVLLVML